MSRYIQCADCGDQIEMRSHNHARCRECASERKRKYQREYQRLIYWAKPEVREYQRKRALEYCRSHREERAEYQREYRRRDYVAEAHRERERERARLKGPPSPEERKRERERARERRQRPEVKAQRSAYRRRPDVRAREAAWGAERRRRRRAEGLARADEIIANNQRLRALLPGEESEG